MRPPRAAAGTAAPTISAAGFSVLEDNDILHAVGEIVGNSVAGGGGGGLFGSLPVVGTGRDQEINAATTEVRFGGENGNMTDEVVVVVGGSGEDVSRIGI